MFFGGRKLEHLDVFEGNQFVQSFFALAQAQLTKRPQPLHRQHLVCTAVFCVPTYVRVCVCVNVSECVCVCVHLCVCECVSALQKCKGHFKPAWFSSVASVQK